MNRTRAPTAISMLAILSTAGVRAIAVGALLATLGGCGRQPVDPKLVGNWQTAVASPAGPYQLRLTTTASGAYRTMSQGSSPMPPETGSFTAASGQWRREKLDGGSDEGTYEVLSADTVLFKSKTETLLWNRVPNDAAAGAAQQSAELVEAGPFGAPLQAAVAAPQSATSGSAFGAAAPTALQPSASGASSPPQVPSTAPSPGADPAQPPSYVQHARQAKAQAHSAASEAQAAASDAQTAVKAQADEVGKSLGPFRKAGSKIKNFFTGHKSQDDNNSSGQAAPDNH
jgi:hypothetical protein